jgi:hypothetical protein
MSGTINLAFSQQVDQDGRPLAGGLLYFFAAGTTTPQLAFQDSALTLPLPNPIVLDAAGRIPMFYLADGTIKIRLTDENGVTVIAADQLLVIGPSSGGGGGGSVDPTTIMATGDMKARYGTGTLTGFVRCNSLSISKSGAGGVERANDDCQALFEYLWQFSNITLNTGKGASANADWLAGRQLFLPDLRGRAMFGMDDMGAPAAGRLTTAGFGVSGTVIGNTGAAAETVTLVQAHLPPHAHGQQGSFGGSFTTGANSVDHTHSTFVSLSGNTGGMSANNPHSHSYNQSNSGNFGAQAGAGGSVNQGLNASTVGSTDIDHTHSWSGSGNFGSGGVSQNHTHNGSVSIAISGNTTSVGSSTPISRIPPGMVITYYIKL